MSPGCAGQPSILIGAWGGCTQTKQRREGRSRCHSTAKPFQYCRRRSASTEIVFTLKGKPIEQVSTAAWYKALGRAGIENFRWQDLRHTWASWHIQGGTPLNILQELGGWASYSMVQRYANLAAEHLAPWAERLSNRGTNPSQPQTEQRLA